MEHSGCTPRRLGSALTAVAATGVLTLGAQAQATSQGRVADGTQAGTSPCGDCAGTRTVSDRQVPRTLFRGTLSREADRLLLAACEGGDVVRVHDVSPEVMITAAITDIGFDRSGSVYLEAWGRMRDGELMIDRLNRAGVEMACPAEPVEFQAQGNEPGWTLVSDRKGITFKRADRAALNAPSRPLSWRWPEGRPDRAEARLTTSTEGSALTAVLDPKICRDTMADAVYGFTASLHVARPEPAGEFTGCAFLGAESPP